MGRRVITEALTQKMNALRSSGMSNQQIGLELGLSYSTVHRCIGPQPTGCRSEYGSIVAHVTDVPPSPPAALPEAPAIQKHASALRLDRFVKTYLGHYTYKFDNLGKLQILTDQGTGINVDNTQNLEALITELMDIYEMMTGEEAS